MVITTVTEKDMSDRPFLYWETTRALDPDDTRPYVPADSKIRIVGRYALVWNIAGGRERPTLWSDIARALPNRFVTYPTIRRLR